MRFLLDTDICIYLIKNRPPEVLETFRQHRPSDIGISSVTLFELQYGAEKSNQRLKALKALEHFISPLSVADFDADAAAQAAAIRAQLEAKGTPIGPYDVLIAGVARSKRLVLVTNNLREFSRVEGLRVENWA